MEQNVLIWQCKSYDKEKKIHEELGTEKNRNIKANQDEQLSCDEQTQLAPCGVFSCRAFGLPGSLFTSYLLY
jgi:hypothetical protein